MRAELWMKFNFVASHSLGGYEKPHPHLWRLEVSLVGNPTHGKIVDMIETRAMIDLVLQPLKNVYLNDCAAVSQDVREAPTCETLSRYFWSEMKALVRSLAQTQNPSLQLSSVAIALCDLNGVETGLVKLTESPSSEL